MFRKTLFIFLLLLPVCAVFAQSTESKSDRKFAFFLGGEGGYLGVETGEVTKENFSKLGLSRVQGVSVEKVLENSPAAQAGLQKGDVIIKFNGDPVTGTRKLMRLLGEVAPDHQAVLTVVRGGAEREITITLGQRPGMPMSENGRFATRVPFPSGQFPQFPPSGLPQIRQLPPNGELPLLREGMRSDVFLLGFGGRQIGIAATALTKQLAGYFGVSEGQGLLVTEVLENSPAARAGLKAGDVIVEADDKEIKAVMDLMRALSEKKEGEVTLTVFRDKNRQTIRVLPEASKEDFRQFEKFDKPSPISPVNK